MKKKFILIGSIVLLLALLLLMGCRQEVAEEEEENNEFERIAEIEGFRSLSGFRVEEGGFYFTGIKGNDWYFYRLDLKTRELKEMHQRAEAYDLYIPLDGERAIYVDLDRQLLYSINDEEKKIAEDITGDRRPNLLLSPNRDAVLYTTGSEEGSDLYLYHLEGEEKLLIKEDISENALNTFGFTTQWSNEKNHFLFNNREIYDDQGNRYAVIDATMAKWSPDDNYIAFIRKPENLREEEIIIGGWQTYIGYEFMLFHLESLESEGIYQTPQGLIDEIDSIQWSKDGQMVGISLGEISKGRENHLQSVDYEAVFAYDIARGEGEKIEGIPYNYYEMLFHTHIYGSSLGREDALEIIEVFGEERMKYEDSVLLNSQDMFIISHDHEGYFMDGTDLIRIVPQGKVETVATLPWKMRQLYFDDTTRNFIIINEDYHLYIRKTE